MAQRHFNPMHNAFQYGDNGREDSDEYVQVTIKVVEIRDKSVVYETSPMQSDYLARSLMHAASEDKIINYRGPLPMEFRLGVRKWIADKKKLVYKF
jgi:hypothetical protein